MLTALEQESMRRALGHFQFRMKAFSQQKLVWEYNGSSGEISSQKPDSILDIFTMCGAIKLVASFSGKMGQKKLEASDWKEWFLSRAGDCHLIPDTNFIRNHYCSSTLSRILGDSFKKLRFRMSRLVVLEIERQGNQKNEMEKRLAFYAAREIDFFKKNVDFGPLPDAGDKLITSFPTQAGEGFTDMWIRREIHNAIQMGIRPTLFLTSDLMNALAAEAEGLETCYFARLPQDSFCIDADYPSQLFDLILATAIKFNDVQLDIILTGDDVFQSYNLQAMWSGKTTSEWYSDSISVTPIIKTQKK
jgi:hypothetical protein